MARNPQESGAKIVVFPHPRIRGWDGDPSDLEEGRLHLGEIMPLREALRETYDTDAHAVQYAPPSGERCARLNKASLGYFEKREDPDSLQSLPTINAVFVDVDMPDVGPHSWDNMGSWPKRLEDWWSGVLSAVDRTPELQHAGAYGTRGGLRFVWPLEKSLRMSAGKAEDYLTKFKSYLDDQGLNHDQLCDWTRLYRLPRVERDGVLQDWWMDLSEMEPLSWADYNELTSAAPSARGSAALSEDDMPDPESLDDPKRSDLKPFENQWYYRQLRKSLPLRHPDKDSRHNTILEVAGSIVSILDTCDPTEPFQILKPSVETLIEEQSASDRTLSWKEVWRLCVWVCQIQDGQREMSEEEREGFLSDQADAMGCEPEEVTSRLILAPVSGGSYYVWNEQKKEYSEPISNQTVLLTRLQQKAPRLSGIRFESSPDSDRELLQSYGETVDQVIISYERDKTEYDAERSILYESAFSIDDRLRPVYNEKIDQWLRRLFGNRVEEGLDWLASFTNFSAGLCALYIDGPTEIGKGLLVHGLERLWGGSASVPYSELMNDFQGSMQDCPLIVADEKVPTDPFGESGSSIFRRILGKGKMKIRRKYRSPADLEGYPRVVITANNDRALEIEEALTEDDIEAIRRRIGYIDTNEEPRAYLQELAEARGESVQQMAKSWVSGGGIAQHVLYLSEHRDVEPGDRFLVEGWESRLTQSLGTRFGAAPAIGKYVARAIRDKARTEAIRISEEDIWLNPDHLRRTWDRIVSRQSDPPGDVPAMKALRILSRGERRKSEDGRYYWLLNREKIISIAEDYKITDRETIETTVQQWPNDDIDTLESVEPGSRDVSAH